MADITRTFFVGSASPEHRDIYEAVRAANELGRTIAAPPMTLDTLDRRVTESLARRRLRRSRAAPRPATASASTCTRRRR